MSKKKPVMAWEKWCIKFPSGELAVKFYDTHHIAETVLLTEFGCNVDLKIVRVSIREVPRSKMGRKK